MFTFLIQSNNHSRQTALHVVYYQCDQIGLFWRWKLQVILLKEPKYLESFDDIFCDKCPFLRKKAMDIFGQLLGKIFLFLHLVTLPIIPNMKSSNVLIFLDLNGNLLFSVARRSSGEWRKIDCDNCNTLLNNIIKYVWLVFPLSNLFQSLCIFSWPNYYLLKIKNFCKNYMTAHFAFLHRLKTIKF